MATQDPRLCSSATGHEVTRPALRPLIPIRSKPFTALTVGMRLSHCVAWNSVTSKKAGRDPQNLSGQTETDHNKLYMYPPELVRVCELATFFNVVVSSCFRLSTVSIKVFRRNHSCSNRPLSTLLGIGGI